VSQLRRLVASCPLWRPGFEPESSCCSLWTKLHWCRYSGFPCQEFTDCSTLIIMWGWYSGPVVASVTVNTVPFHPKKKKKKLLHIISRFPEMHFNIFESYLFPCLHNRNGYVCIPTGLWTGGEGINSWQRQNISIISIQSRAVLRHIQPPTQWVLWRGGGLSSEYKSGWSVMLTTRLQLAPRRCLYFNSPIHLHGIVLSFVTRQPSYRYSVQDDVAWHLTAISQSHLSSASSQPTSCLRKFLNLS
jgi:hypothetical protein